MLLARGLGGRSRTRVAVCVDQDPRNAAETLDALRFGADCAMVKNRDAGSALSRVVALVKVLDLDIPDHLCRQIQPLDAGLQVRDRVAEIVC